MIVERSAVSEYASYLALEEVLATQRPRSEEHDELLFIVVHQVHELWFKQLLHELAAAQRHLEAAESAPALHSLRRCLSILRAVLSPIDVLETLTPRQFAGFRAKLGTGSGFQSAQFRQVEAVLGRRDQRMVGYYPKRGPERAQIEAAMARPSVYDSLLRHLSRLGHPVPPHLLRRDVSTPASPSTEVQDVLMRIYLDDGITAQICDRLS